MLAAHAWSARLLQRYGPACRAQALSVWSCTHGRLDLVCEWLGSQRLHNLFRTHWPELVDKLRDGHPAALGEATRVLAVRTPREELLGALLFTGTWPQSTGVRALLDDLSDRLGLALRDPLPAPEPDVLSLPLAHVNVPGGDRLALRRVYTAVLDAHGGSLTLASQVLAMPRQSLATRVKRLGVSSTGLCLLRVLPEPTDLDEEALDLERRTCLAILERCRGDVRLSAVTLGLTPDAWRSYLLALKIEPPTRRRRPPRRASK